MSIESVRTCDYCRKQATGKDGFLPSGWVHITAMRGDDWFDFDCCDICTARDPTMRMILHDPEKDVDVELES